jgi:GNAT superfamily N-acetyltransferase
MTRVWLFDPRGPSRSCPPAWMRSPRFGVRAVAAGGRRRDGVLNSVPFDWLRRECPCRSLWSTPADLAELLPLMRAYCDFYQVAPGDQALLELSQALLADPQREGVQLLARDDTGRVVGFATLFWTWQTLAATRVGVMNDLYVAAEARGVGVADGLIAACLERCREHGATQLIWQTAVDNHRAQAVYERLGATREDRWLGYQLPVDPG